MKKIIYLFATALLLIPLSAMAANKTDEKLEKEIMKVLEQNPELVLDVIRKNDRAVLEIVQQAAIKENEARQREGIKKGARLEPYIDKERPVRGNPDAAVTIVEYSDFQCPYCGRAAVTLDKILKKYKGDVRLIYKHFPLPSHKYAELVARYFEAIALQDHKKAWLFHDKAFENQGSLTGGEEAATKIAAHIGADMERLKQDLQKPVINERIKKDLSEGSKFGFSGTPSFLINGVKLIGAQPEESFSEIIDIVLKERR